MKNICDFPETESVCVCVWNQPFVYKLFYYVWNRRFRLFWCSDESTWTCKPILYSAIVYLLVSAIESIITTKILYAVTPCQNCTSSFSLFFHVCYICIYIYIYTNVCSYYSLFTEVKRVQVNGPHRRNRNGLKTVEKKICVVTRILYPV